MWGPGRNHDGLVDRKVVSVSLVYGILYCLLHDKKLFYSVNNSNRMANIIINHTRNESDVEQCAVIGTSNGVCLNDIGL